MKELMKINSNGVIMWRDTSSHHWQTRKSIDDTMLIWRGDTDVGKIMSHIGSIAA
jgi:hypothetical protein